MNPVVTRQLVSACSIVLLAVFLSACGSNPVTPTVRGQPTIATTSTQAAPTKTPFQQLTGSHFTILYPANWKTSHVSQPGGQSGDHTQPQTEDTYAFVAQDNLTGLHIVRNGDEQAVDGMIIALVGGADKCKTPVMSQVTVGGVIWSQADVVCLVAGSSYEARELVYGSPRYGQTVIMYGAYQQVGNGAVVPDFIHANNTYFKPMLASFKFNDQV
jgi:hypothetical protein